MELVRCWLLHIQSHSTYLSWLCRIWPLCYKLFVYVSCFRSSCSLSCQTTDILEWACPLQGPQSRLMMKSNTLAVWNCMITFNARYCPLIVVNGCYSAASLSFHSLIVLFYKGKTSNLPRIFSHCRTHKILGKDRENAKITKEIPCLKLTKEILKTKERKDRVVSTVC